ncbi:uncharacterized protein LOC62_02G001826 [Vanrija pseudolonga]|uniref:Protein kinase domain-containing protein n=1 Tax=Vanrija pseudolonga TaxID=143232 RepID=A0AAF0Y1C7_9TREE|nr:hypothetical protein LOC62_02G001826 [Vanrija pseudolonga]
MTPYRPRAIEIADTNEVRLSAFPIPNDPKVFTIRVWKDRHGHFYRQEVEYLRTELDEDGDPGPPMTIEGTRIDMKTIWPRYKRSWPKWRRGRGLSRNTPVFHKFTELPIFEVGGLVSVLVVFAHYRQEFVKAEQSHTVREIYINEMVSSAQHANLLPFLGCEVEGGRVASLVFPFLYWTLEDAVCGMFNKNVPSRALKWTHVSLSSQHVRFTRNGKMSDRRDHCKEEDFVEVFTPIMAIGNVMTDITAAVTYLRDTYQLCYLNLAPHNVMYNHKNDKWVIVGLGECHKEGTTFANGIPGPMGWTENSNTVTWGVVLSMLVEIENYIKTGEYPRVTHWLNSSQICSSDMH